MNEAAWCYETGFGCKVDMVSHLRPCSFSILTNFISIVRLVIIALLNRTVAKYSAIHGLHPLRAL